MTSSRRGNVDRGLEPVSKIVGRVLSDGKLRGFTQMAMLWARWRELVGSDVAEHCFPEKIDDGKLYVKVDSPVWHQQLDLLKDEIKGKMDQKLEASGVEKIIFRLGVGDAQAFPRLFGQDRPGQ